MTYQDVLIHGEVTTKGERDCVLRWSAIKDAINRRYTRRVSILDIGASEGYFSFLAARELGAVPVMVEKSDDLARLAAVNRAYPTIHLNHRITVDELERMADCEHYDVVLALNVLHHFPPLHVERALAAVMRLGDVVIIETPAADDKGACGQGAIPVIFKAMKSEGWGEKRMIALTPSHVTASVRRPMFEFFRPRSYLVRAYIDSTEPLTSEISIDSTSTTKTFTKGGGTRDWVHGINLRTWQMLGGERGWPQRDGVVEMLETEMMKWTLPTPVRHGDVRPWNFILTGHSTTLIDGNDGRAVYDDGEGWEKTIAEIKGEEVEW